MQDHQAREAILCIWGWSDGELGHAERIWLLWDMRRSAWTRLLLHELKDD
jgi:hypothetical protein